MMTAVNTQTEAVVREIYETEYVHVLLHCPCCNRIYATTYTHGSRPVHLGRCPCGVSLILPRRERA